MSLLDPGPLYLLVAGLFVSHFYVWLAERILWGIYDPRGYLEALAAVEGLAEKIRELRSSGDRRSLRKAQLLEARLAPLRSLLLRVSLTRGILYTLSYLASSTTLTILFPGLYPAPLYIPVLTVAYRGGIYYGAPQVAMLSTVVAIVTLMGPGRLRMGLSRAGGGGG